MLQAVLGKPPSLFRPPTGKLTSWVIWSLWRQGYRLVLWNSDPKDYAMASTAELSDWLRGHRFNPGDIVLMHDNQPYAAGALPEAIREARERGLEFATMEHPAISRNGHG